jgi:hypothetical protein
MIKWIIKWTLRVLVVVVVLVVLVLSLKDSFMRKVIETRIRNETGMEARLGRFSSGIFSPVMTLENLKLYNTPEFGGTLLLDIPELHVEMDSISLAQHKLRVRLIRLNLAEFDIVKNQAGQTNIMSLTTKVQSLSSGKGKGIAQSRVGDLEFVGIDVLNLSIGKERFVDLKDSTQNREVVVNLQNQVFNNVKSDGDILGIMATLWLRSNGKLGLLAPGVPRPRVESKPIQLETSAPTGTNRSPVPVAGK